jgi:NADH-quinone oxidoreductase subunit L
LASAYFFGAITSNPAGIKFHFSIGFKSAISRDFWFSIRLSILWLLFVTGIGSLIHMYSISYMHDDENMHKYFAYLNLFIFFMITLVIGSNLLVLFIGWEGVGLCSYLLIGFGIKSRL